MPLLRFAAVVVVLAAAPAFAAKPTGGVNRPDDPPGRLHSDAWRGVPFTPITPAEIDQLLAKEHAATGTRPAGVMSDELFVRRVTLDLVGRLPLPADVTEFAADRSPDKRAKLIDKLLASDAYARHWGNYWRDVVLAKVSDIRGRAMVGSFELWLIEQFAANRPWDAMARDMITSTGKVQLTAPSAAGGDAYLLLAYNGPDAINDRTAEVSRVFLGIQIQCAQCHDHPFDEWKQIQFHELAAFLARVRERLIPAQAGGGPGIELVSAPFGEHQMPHRDPTGRGTTVLPKFLTGQTLPGNPSDRERRQALADFITHKDNYWFAAAFVNRMWGELFGRAFVEPVDDLGLNREVLMPAVLSRLAASFSATGYDIKALLKAICLSEAYQRTIRPLGSGEDHQRFAARSPARLSAPALWEAVTNVLGQPPESPTIGRFAGAAFGRRPQGFEQMFQAEFAFDPSAKPDEVEGSVSQALLLMNSPFVHSRIRAVGPTLLGKVLKAYPEDADAVRAVYLRALARTPTAKELDRALGYIKSVGDRAEAFEDLLWALLNSTEFQTRR